MRWIILFLLLVSCEKEIFITETVYIDPAAEHPGILVLTNEYVSGTFMLTTNESWRLWDTIVPPGWFEIGTSKTLTLDESEYRIELKYGDNYYYSAKVSVFRDSIVYRTIAAF